jgi:hypothetical protein
MKIKELVLLYKQVVAMYEVDVDGTKINVSYCYDMDDEGKGGWDWDLTPCYEGLDEDEILDLEEEFEIVISDMEL